MSPTSLSLLDGLAGSQTVLVAVDDVQWLDLPTPRVVEFAVRRCSGPVAVLTLRRVEGEGSSGNGLVPRDATRRRVVRLGRFSLGALHHVVKGQTGRSPELACRTGSLFSRATCTTPMRHRACEAVVVPHPRVAAAGVRALVTPWPVRWSPPLVIGRSGRAELVWGNPGREACGSPGLVTADDVGGVVEAECL
jgi:hypothetical protein